MPSWRPDSRAPRNIGTRQPLPQSKALLTRRSITRSRRHSPLFRHGFVTTEAAAAAPRPSNCTRRNRMAEKIKKLNLERDYKKYLYFIDGEGNVCQKAISRVRHEAPRSRQSRQAKTGAAARVGDRRLPD